MPVLFIGRRSSMNGIEDTGGKRNSNIKNSIGDISLLANQGHVKIND